MSDGCELAIVGILVLMADVCLEVVVGDHKVSLKKDANGVVNSCAPDNQQWVFFVKLVVYLVDVATNSYRLYSQQLQIVLVQGLSGGDGVNGG